MELVYLGIVIFLFMLAVFDLLVGVSNDAVNFLNSAVGARVATFRTILIVASVGVFAGATMSNGMMDIARHGIFQPTYFTFYELMCIFLAVMVTDVVLLDVFNTLGMPTSTTVSMVFELLGGTFILALLKILADSTGMLSFGTLLNTEKALSVILGIFLSVAIAFIAGVVVQYISRLVFTFNYVKHLKWTIGIFGGIAATSLAYFILIKGLEMAPFMTPESLSWLDQNTAWLVGGCFVLFTVLMQVLHWCGVNVFKVIVLLGTFALALAFAGNDLVNFIGVPLAGYSSYLDYTANAGGADVHSFLPFPCGAHHGLCLGHVEEGAQCDQDFGRLGSPGGGRGDVRLLAHGAPDCTPLPGGGRVGAALYAETCGRMDRQPFQQG